MNVFGFLFHVANCKVDRVVKRRESLGLHDVIRDKLLERFGIAGKLREDQLRPAVKGHQQKLIIGVEVRIKQVECPIDHEGQIGPHASTLVENECNRNRTGVAHAFDDVLFDPIFKHFKILPREASCDSSLLIQSDYRHLDKFGACRESWNFGLADAKQVCDDREK